MNFTVELPQIPNVEYNIKEFGAVNGGTVSNTEAINNAIVKAHENTPSSFCGRIEYTCGGGGENSKTFTFWDSTSGKNFKTVNLTHAEGGTTALRNTYTPNYMQQYYDDDLGKMLIYNGTNWVDSNGNIV